MTCWAKWKCLTRLPLWRRKRSKKQSKSVWITNDDGLSLKKEKSPPPHQQCSEVVLGGHQTPMQCWFWGRTSTPRLRLCVLAFLLINIELKLHSEESKYTSASPRCTCFPPRATSTQVRLVQVQVHLGFASVYLNLDSAYLRGVSGGHLVQLQLKSTSPRCRTYTKVSHPVTNVTSGASCDVKHFHI